MNERIFEWFDSGKAVDALLGAEPYFLPETTYADRHDRILVLDQLMLWAVARGALPEAAAALMAALVQASDDLDDWSAYDLVWSYLLVAEDHDHRLPIESSDILTLLDELDRRASSPGEETRILRSRVRARLVDDPIPPC